MKMSDLNKYMKQVDEEEFESLALALIKIFKEE